MHRVGDRRYVGGPGETVTVTTQVGGGGQESRDVDGQPLVGNQFPLPGGAGGTRRLRITLVGPVGASSVVGISVVDGGQDGDLLLCQPHDPAPVQFYDFAVAPMAALESLAKIRKVREKVKEPPAAKARKTRPPRKKAKTAKAARTRRTGRGKRGGGR